MELSPEQKEALEKQKEQCPFCKIIKGEIPSRKVYEDDNVIAILDINPATKGHALVMPKEHYPIMALMPPQEFNEFFGKVAEISEAIKDGMVAQGTSLFIANGFAAGQQSQHFMMHIIPREEGDGLSNFDVPHKEVDQADIKDALANNLKIMVGKRSPKAAPQQPQQGQPKISMDQLLQVLDANAQIKKLLIEDPDLFKTHYQENPQLQQIFEGFDIDDIRQRVMEREGIIEEKKEPVQSQNEAEHAPAEEKGDNNSSAGQEEHSPVGGDENHSSEGESEQQQSKKESEEADLDDIADLFK